jgi:hypothetical protein
MTGISLTITSNLDTELQHLKQFPKEMKLRAKKEMTTWYNKDFRPYAGRLIRGLKGKDIPSKNSEPYATYKATGIWTDRRGREHPYNIVKTSTHSLGEVGKQWGRHAHAPGQLYRGVMNTKARFEETEKSIRLKAVFNKPFYLATVHDGLYNLKQAYPFIDAAIQAKMELLIKRIEDGIVLDWDD